MSERLTYVPEKTHDFKVDEKKTPEPSEEIKRQIQAGPDKTQRPFEAVGTETSHFLDQAGQPITHERKPLQVSPEKQAEREAGLHGKSIFSDDPNQTIAANDQVTGTDVDEKAQVEKPDTSGNYELTEKTKLRIQSLNKDIEQAEEVKADMIAESHEAMKANDMEQADRSLSTAKKAEEAVVNMRLEQSSLQVEIDKLEDQ